MTPTQIKIKDRHLLIKWDDDTDSKIKLVNLRRNCPCALCASESEEQSSSYIPIYTDEQLSVKEINLVGNYAVGISWKDNHNTGIYVFAQLKRLSE